MKPELVVFYAWQSNRPDTRNLIGDALERAVKTVTRNGDIAHAARMDSDTRGLPGSPDIANTILAKIQTSDVFVGDVSLREGDERVGPNPNVLVELGYAAAELGWDRVVMVMNDTPTEDPRSCRSIFGGAEFWRTRRRWTKHPPNRGTELVRKLVRALETLEPRRENQAIEPRPRVGWDSDLRETLNLVAPVDPRVLEADRRRQSMFTKEDLAGLNAEDRTRAEYYNERLATHCAELE